MAGALLKHGEKGNVRTNGWNLSTNSMSKPLSGPSLQCDGITSEKPRLLRNFCIQIVNQVMCGATVTFAKQN